MWQNYINRTRSAFASGSAQEPVGVAEVVVQTATEAQPHFRYQTSATAQAFVSLKLSDLDGDKVTGYTATWIK